MYVILSYFSNGSGKPKLDFTRDKKQEVGDLLDYACSALKNGKDIEVYDLENGSAKLIYNSVRFETENENNTF